ncbi:hypothetical protein GSI_11882 [Ganoderma sinense ZZ0214-1]|uniref:F-box domain-containing protein n=1 Tax=Ganoderma sinense ZZ0214-1 TaxID=1077348 RepID=A0A2G8RXB0_9APHY|nr:hypothetical protein GSI_11882 [Ganoderma sinense ZZ0214-1]
MHKSSPFLETLTIHLGPKHDALGLSPVQELICLHRLHEVVISEIQGLSAFRTIVTKPNLTNLDVTIHRRDVNGPRVALGRAVSVHDLRELTVRSSDTSVVSDLLKLVRFYALKTAVFHLGSPEGSQDLEVVSTDISTFLGLFYNSVSDSDLQSFELSASTQAFQPAGPSEPVALRELLAPILPIRGLHSFSLLTSGTLTTSATVMARLDDTDICVLSTAWPKLERLALNRRNFTPESSISLNALHHLYTHGTYLQALSIPRLRWPIIGVHCIPSPLDCLQAHPLRRISMQDSGLEPGLSDEGAEAMARYLLELFPSLSLWRNAERNAYAFLRSDE